MIAPMSFTVEDGPLEEAEYRQWVDRSSGHVDTARMHPEVRRKLVTIVFECDEHDVPELQAMFRAREAR